MKTITIYELRDLVAEKLGLTCKAETFEEFRKFIDDVYSQFGLRWETLDDQAYYWHNASMCDRNIDTTSALLKVGYEEANKALGLKDAEFYATDSDDYEDFEAPYAIQAEKASVNYVDNEGISISKMIAVWQELCKKYGGECVVRIGEIGNDEYYCNVHMEWKVSADKIEPQGCFVQVVDDGAGRLMDAIYWLCECYGFDTFAEFEKFGVELRYETRDKAEGLACEE